MAAMLATAAWLLPPAVPPAQESAERVERPARVNRARVGEEALWPTSISNWTGAILLYRRTVDGWAFVDECAEWASFAA